MHIISLVVCYLVIVIVFLMFMHGAKKLRLEKERELCMMNHPAGKLAPIEHSLSGEIEESLRMNHKYDWELTEKMWHLKGD